MNLDLADESESECRTVLVPIEQYGRIENIARNNESYEPRRITGVVNEAGRDFVTHETLKTAMNEDLQVYFRDNQAFIDDEKQHGRTIKITQIPSTGRLFCDKCKLLKTDCPHTLWASKNKKIPDYFEKINKTKIPRPLPKVKITKKEKKPVRVNRELYDKIEKIQKRIELYKDWDTPDFLVQIVLAYWDSK